MYCALYKVYTRTYTMKYTFIIHEKYTCRHLRRALAFVVEILWGK